MLHKIHIVGYQLIHFKSVKFLTAINRLIINVPTSNNPVFHLIGRKSKSYKYARISFLLPMLRTHDRTSSVWISTCGILIGTFTTTLKPQSDAVAPSAG